MQEMEELQGRAVALASEDMTDSDSDSDEEDAESTSESESSSSDSDSDSDSDSEDSLDTAQAVARRKVLAGEHRPHLPIACGVRLQRLGFHWI